MNLPERADAAFGWSAAPADPLDRPELYDGILWRRSFAFAVDFTIISIVMLAAWIFNTVTFGLFGLFIGLLWPAIFVVYAVFFIGGPECATIGMRWMGLQIRNLDGGAPTRLQAGVMSILFLVTMSVTSGLLLILPLFLNRRRCLHDILSGVVAVRAMPSRAVG